MLAIAPATSKPDNPVLCNSRALLVGSRVSIDRGDYIAAGCQLREALRQLVWAECVYWDCLPKRTDRRTPLKLVKALRQAGKIQRGTGKWFMDTLEIGNKCAHCVLVPPGVIRAAISYADAMLDGCPYLLETSFVEGGVQ